VIVLIWLIVALLLLPVLVITLECIAALLPGGERSECATERPGLAVLMPAHNEAVVIADTLATLIPQLQEGDHLLVVADNCTDDTADIARAAGATVIERQHEQDRGKGFALAYGMDELRRDPPAVLIMVDADCIVECGSIDTLARTAAKYDQPIQALDLMQTGAQAPLKIKVAVFAWAVKNKVRPMGLSRFGLPCALMGTGMAFPWHIIKDTDMGGGAIAEDMQMGIELALQGHPARFCPAALVTSSFPTAEQDAGTQRRRWEHGHISTILAYAPKLLLAALRQRDVALLALGLDLMVPPLALLSIFMLIGLILTACVILFGVNNAAFIVLFSAGLLYAFVLMLVWFWYGRDVITFRELLAIPGYIFSKVSLYFSFIFSRESKWIKTGRDDADE